VEVENCGLEIEEDLTTAEFLTTSLTGRTLLVIRPHNALKWE